MDFFNEIKASSLQLIGLSSATHIHNEGWWFSQAGRFIAYPLRVFRKPLSESVRNGNLFCGRTYLFADTPEFRDVVPQNRVLSTLQSLARTLHGDEGIAVAVATDPGSEGQWLWQLIDGDAQPIHIFECIANFRVDTRKGFED